VLNEISILSDNVVSLAALPLRYTICGSPCIYNHNYLQ